MILDSNLESEISYYYHGMDVKEFRNIFLEEARHLNEQGYDIFWCLNSFNNGVRRKSELRAVNALVADFDYIDEQGLREKLSDRPRPTSIVKTKKGFHLYWLLKTPTKLDPDEYKNFVSERLCPIGADPNAKDVCRVLRTPNFRYWQNSKGERFVDEEILIKEIFSNGPRWEWKDLVKLFPKILVEEDFKPVVQRSKNHGGFWDKVNSLSVEDCILKLSGTRWVKNQNLKFSKQGKLKRLYVNGKPSNGWIDGNGRFGSLYDKTAGSIYNFLCFPEYGLSVSDIKIICEEVFNVRD